MATKAAPPRPTPAPDLPRFEVRIDPDAPAGDLLPPLARLLLTLARREAASSTAASAEKEAAR